MHRIALGFVLLFAGALAAARPMLIHETQRIDPPGTYDFFAYSLAVDGDWAIITAGNQSDGGNAFPQQDFALLYHRVGARWVFDRVLLSESSATQDDWTGIQVAMSNGLAALQFSPFYVFQRNGNNWTQVPHPFNAPRGNPDWVNGEIHWSGNTLLAGYRCIYSVRAWGAFVATRNADGTWTTPQRIDSNDDACNEEPSTYDISGDTVTVATRSNDFEIVWDRVGVFRRVGDSWQESAPLPSGEGVAAVRGSEIFVSRQGPDGTDVYRDDGSQAVVDNLRTVAAAHVDSGRAYQIVHSGELLLQTNNDVDRFGAINVFRKNAAGRYEHVAILMSRGNDSLWGKMAVSGRRVLVSGSHDRTSANPAVFAFDLPETFVATPSRQFTFESGNANGWTPGAGSQFAVATSGANRVYRQSSLAGDARAVRTEGNWTDQSIEADIQPTAFNTGDRWAGLAVRYTDDSNYYYVTLRNSGTIELRRVLDGAITILAQKQFSVVAGGRYHVALKALGQQLQVYLDGKPFLFKHDAALTHGRAALVTYQAQADYDNVIVNQIGQSTLFENSYSCETPLDRDAVWTLSGTGEWGCPEYWQIRQTSVAGDARAVVGVPTDDQMTRTRVRATAFAAPSGTQERWFGVAARYRDPGNYYYLSLRSSNTVSLRKVVNGAITVLGSVPLAVTPGTWYDLRLDAVEDQLRAYVNGVLLLQATDSTHATGQSGPLTFKAAAEYDRFLSYQP